MSMQPPRNPRRIPLKQDVVATPGDAELARYVRVLSEYKIETTVLQQILEQHRARRQVGWRHEKNTL